MAASGRPPIDFSPSAVSRAVLGHTLSRPHVLYPLAVGLLGGLATVALGPATLFVVPAVAGTALGLGGWAVDYGFRRERHAENYLRRLQASLAGRVDETIAQLRQEFGQLQYAPGTAQLAALRDKYEAFDALLRRKLNPSEMTFTRYLGMAEQVFLAGLDNLTRIADTLRGLAAIDVRHIDARLMHLHGDGVESEAQDREIATLNERRVLRARQNERIDAWLSENERAMTQIDHAMAAIAALDTSQGHAQMDMESAMAELRRLAERAPQYSSPATSSST